MTHVNDETCCNTVRYDQRRELMNTHEYVKNNENGDKRWKLLKHGENEENHMKHTVKTMNNDAQ